MDALDSLNDLLAAWNLEPLLLPTTRISGIVLPFSSNGNFSVVVGGDINIPTPERIDQASRLTGLTTNDLEIPLRVVRTVREWQTLTNKLSQSTQMSAVWYDPPGPLTNTGTLHVYPVPTVAGQILVLYTQSRFAPVPALNTTIDLPDGHNRAIRYNLGVEIAPEFGKELPTGWEKLAVDSKAKLKSIHIQDGKLDLSGVMGSTNSRGGGYNILSDGNNR
jgi:hypothetical protein